VASPDEVAHALGTDESGASRQTQQDHEQRCLIGTTDRIACALTVRSARPPPLPTGGENDGSAVE
jgi:hypothetical protein